MYIPEKCSILGNNPNFLHIATYNRAQFTHTTHHKTIIIVSMRKFTSLVLFLPIPKLQLHTQLFDRHFWTALDSPLARLCQPAIFHSAYRCLVYLLASTDTNLCYPAAFLSLRTGPLFQTVLSPIVQRTGTVPSGPSTSIDKTRHSHWKFALSH